MVVVANEPMPSVSKKFVRKPMPSRRGDVRDHSVTKTAVTSRRAASRMVLGSENVTG